MIGILRTETGIEIGTENVIEADIGMAIGIETEVGTKAEIGTGIGIGLGTGTGKGKGIEDMIMTEGPSIQREKAGGNMRTVIGAGAEAEAGAEVGVC